MIAVINHTPLLANQIEHVVLGKFQLPMVLLVPFPMIDFCCHSCFIIEILDTFHLELIPLSRGFRTKDKKLEMLTMVFLLVVLYSYSTYLF